MDIKHLLEDCKIKLKEYYGQNFHSLILYGSMARKRNDRSSDIDLLVLLSEPFDYFKELKEIVTILYPVQLNSEYLISAKPAATKDFTSGKTHFYRTVRREGSAV